MVCLTFADFFTAKDEFGNYKREIGSYEPIYIAGYIQDKFEKQKKEFKKQSKSDAIWETYLLRNKIYAHDYTDLRAYNYMYDFNNDLDLQLYRAGIQLANLLNQLY